MSLDGTGTMRVSEFLAEHHVAFETMVHAPAFSAQRLAKFLQIPGREVVKSVLLASPQGFFLAVLPATCRVNLEEVSRAFKTDVRIATEAELSSLFRDCEHGALTPFGRLYGMTTLLDDEIDSSTAIVFESQRHFLAIRMLCRDFERIEGPTRLALRKKC